MAKAVKKKVAPAKKAGSATDEQELKRTPVKRWIEELERAGKQQRKWEEKCDKINARYVDDRDNDGGSSKKKTDRKYNALWSVMQTLMPLTYSSPPKPYISRRFGDSDPVARDASEILQRALTYSVESECLHDSLEDANEDFNLCSRAVIWTRYSPLFALRETDERCYVEEGEDLPDDVSEDDIEEGDDGRFYYNKKAQAKVDEEMDIDHVLYSDFRHGAASKWRYVPWVARRVPMTRSKLVDRFGDKGAKPPLTIDCKEDITKDASDDEKGLFAKAEVWEIWSKIDRKVFWVCPQWQDEFLDEVVDPLELDGFFPCPRPAYGTKTNKTLIPQPDYLLWQDVALELDELTARIKLLTNALRVVGIYDKQMGDVVKRITSQTDENDMIGVDSWAMMQERGGLKNSIEFFPIDQVVGVLDKLQQRRTVLIQELYETTGVSDVIRGASDPNETLGAQKLKGNYANKRLGRRQDKIARMAREKLEIMAQVICQHYSDETLMRISSAEQWMRTPDGAMFDVRRFFNAVSLLRVGMLRRFRIKIDERSLAAQDLEEDRNERMMFLQGVGQLVTGFATMSQQFPGSKKLLGTLLLFGIRAFPLARTTEAEFEDVLKQFMEAPESGPEQQEKPQEKPGKSEQELAIEAQKVAVQNRRVDAMYEEIKRKYEDDMRDYGLKLQGLQQEWAQFQRESQIRESKVYADTHLRQQQVVDQRIQMQRQAATDERRHERDLNNDRMSAVQAFAAPKPQSAAA